MNHLIKIIPVFIMALVLSSCADQLTDSNGNYNSSAGKDIMLVPGNLSAEEAAGIIFMRQEEKLMRDVYTVLGQTWNLNIFLNIVSSEQNHMDAVKRLIIKYDLVDPVTNDEVGIFADPVFQQLFDDFVQQGQQSIPEAMLVGQAIETQAISSLENQLVFVDNQDIIRVYTKLLAASEKHLSSFTIHITPVF
ncbi:MAG TPA: DUF2202 domain-containing protein [Ignavibacteriaceae bacterium]